MAAPRRIVKPLRAAIISKARRFASRNAPVRTPLLPPASRLDERPDLSHFDIGRFSWGHLTVLHANSDAQLRIGQFCDFAHGCQILLGGEHPTDFVSTYRGPPHSPFRDAMRGVSTTRGGVAIGNDVWIGHGSLILSGVELGDGVAVGAASVVRRDAPPYAILAGNPARVVGFRFPPEQIEALLRIRWWDWTLERIVEFMPLLMSDDIQRFIDANEPTQSA